MNLVNLLSLNLNDYKKFCNDYSGLDNYFYAFKKMIYHIIHLKYL